jgi:hypothetical protein
MEGLRKATKTLRIACLWGRDFNPGPFEYEGGVKTTLPRHTVLSSKLRTMQFSLFLSYASFLIPDILSQRCVFIQAYLKSLFFS